MKRVGILTASRTNNIGTDLQAYAIQSIFSKYAEVEIIDYICDQLEKSHIVFPDLSIKSIYKAPYRVFKNIAHYKFRKKLFKYSPNSYSHTNFGTIGDRYNAIVVGSDQIWNLNLTGFDTSFFLPNDTIIADKYSYAASLGTLDIALWEKEYGISSYLKQFKKVTVRESSGVVALEQIGVHAKEILDPILVADINLWKNFKSRVVKKPYMLIYQVSTPIDMCADAVEYAKKKGWQIIRISEPTRFKRNIKTKSYVTMKKWISLVQNAELIITDSYHGLSFSIANNKNFRLLSLPNAEANTRSLCLINKLNLSEFLYPGLNFTREPNWGEVNTMLSYLRKDAIDYIMEICR